MSSLVSKASAEIAAECGADQANQPERSTTTPSPCATSANKGKTTKKAIKAKFSPPEGAPAKQVLDGVSQEGWVTITVTQTNVPEYLVDLSSGSDASIGFYLDEEGQQIVTAADFVKDSAGSLRIYIKFKD